MGPIRELKKVCLIVVVDLRIAIEDRVVSGETRGGRIGGDIGRSWGRIDFNERHRGYRVHKELGRVRLGKENENHRSKKNRRAKVRPGGRKIAYLREQESNKPTP